MSVRFEDVLLGESFMWRNNLYTRTYAWLAKDEEGKTITLNSQAKVKKVKRKKTPYWVVLLYNWYTVISYYLRMKV